MCMVFGGNEAVTVEIKRNTQIYVEVTSKLISLGLIEISSSNLTKLLESNVTWSLPYIH